MAENSLLEKIIPDTEEIKKPIEKKGKKVQKTVKSSKEMEEKVSKVSDEFSSLKKDVEDLKKIFMDLQSEVGKLAETKQIDFELLNQKIKEIESLKYEKTEGEEIITDTREIERGLALLGSKISQNQKEIQLLTNRIIDIGGKTDQFEKRLEIQDLNKLIQQMEDEVSKVQEIKGYIVSKAPQIDEIHENLDQLVYLRKDLDEVNKSSMENWKRIEENSTDIRKSRTTILQTKVLMLLNSLPYIKDELVLEDVVETVETLIKKLKEIGEWEYGDQAYIKEVIKNLAENEKIRENRQMVSLYTGYSVE
jgi:chromosome segregation ATPase